ncbi:hypothetical protein C8Q74DRAFT_845752 [Fomes fomentarius]|nr:hypothetical protein C8Q74DRAFT_845752 [Fomes fomentarius]
MRMGLAYSLLVTNYTSHFSRRTNASTRRWYLNLAGLGLWPVTPSCRDGRTCNRSVHYSPGHPLCSRSSHPIDHGCQKMVENYMARRTWIRGLLLSKKRRCHCEVSSLSPRQMCSITRMLGSSYIMQRTAPSVVHLDLATRSSDTLSACTSDYGSVCLMKTLASLDMTDGICFREVAPLTSPSISSMNTK